MFTWEEDENNSKDPRVASVPYVWNSAEYDFCGNERNIRVGVAYLHHRYGVPLDVLKVGIPKETGEKTFGTAPTVCASYVDHGKKIVYMVLGERPFRDNGERLSFYRSFANDPVSAMYSDGYFDHSGIIESIRQPLDDGYEFSFGICMRSAVLRKDMIEDIDLLNSYGKRTFSVVRWTIPSSPPRIRLGGFLAGWI